jgi:hypothetical protein
MDVSKANLSSPYFTHHLDHPGTILIPMETIILLGKGHDSGLELQEHFHVLAFNDGTRKITYILKTFMVVVIWDYHLTTLFS